MYGYAPHACLLPTTKSREDVGFPGIGVTQAVGAGNQTLNF